MSIIMQDTFALRLFLVVNVCKIHPPKVYTAAQAASKDVPK